jgi:FlaA1/EpsC-like NDP-sugar epimerase
VNIVRKTLRLESVIFLKLILRLSLKNKFTETKISMLKAGLVGAGHLGKIHLRLLNQSDKYELVGFHDKDVENGKS